jgi:uncharacterized protein (DUF488 family)
MEKKLYSIGHGARKKVEFLQLLKRYEIQCLVDVRSKPYSRFHPQYNREALKNFLASHRIDYIFMGDKLGGRPSDPSCYDTEGHVNYRAIMGKAFFKEGIAELKTIYEGDLRTAIMCSERKPSECHRTWLIGKALEAENFDIMHIDELGKLRTQYEVMADIIPQKGLFD